MPRQLTSAELDESYARARRIAEDCADQCRQQLNSALTWEPLSAERREQLTRAANAAELALFLIMGADVRPVVQI